MADLWPNFAADLWPNFAADLWPNLAGGQSSPFSYAGGPVSRLPQPPQPYPGYSPPFVPEGPSPVAPVAGLAAAPSRRVKWTTVAAPGPQGLAADLWPNFGSDSPQPGQIGLGGGPGAGSMAGLRLGDFFGGR